MLLRGPAAMLAIFFKEMYFKASTTSLISEASSDIWADAKLRKFRTFARECFASKFKVSLGNAKHWNIIFPPISFFSHHHSLRGSISYKFTKSSSMICSWNWTRFNSHWLFIWLQWLIAVYHMAVIWCGHFYNCLVKFKRWNPVILNINPGD